MIHITITTTVSKHEDRRELDERYQAAGDEENRIAALITENDETMRPELIKVQELKTQIEEQLNIPYIYNEIATFSGSSFVDRFFNEENFEGFEFDIDRVKIGEFITNCNLVIENPEVAERLLPVIPRYEPKERETNYYNEDYFAEVREARNIFLNILTNTNWEQEDISLRIDS